MTIEYKDSKRIVKLSTDTANPLIYSDDFTSDNFNYGSANSKFSYDSTNKRMNFDITSNSSTARAYKQLPSTLGGSDWEIRYTIKIDSINATGNTTGVSVAIASNDTGASNAYYVEFSCDSSGRQNYLIANSQGNWSTTNFWSVGTEYFISIKFTASTGKATLNAYTSASDRSAETNPVANSTITKTPSSAPTTLMGYLVVKNERPTNGGSMDGYVKDIQIGDDFSTKPTNVQDNSLLVEKDTARRYWFDEALAPTFEDDFSSDDWTDTGSNIGVNTSTNVLDFNGVTDGSNSASVYDLGAGNVSDTAWVCRFKYTLTSWTNPSGATNYIFIGLSDLPQTTASSASQDFIGFQTTRNLNGSIGRELLDTDGALVLGASGVAMDNPSIGTQWIEIVRTSATQATIKVFSDSTYSTQVGNTVTATVSSGTSGLRYIKVMNRDNVSNGGTLIGSIDDVEFYNDVTTPTPATWTMQPTFQDDFSTDRWVDMDSSKIGVNTTLERLDFDIKRDGSNDGSALDLGRTLSDTKWRVDYDLSLTTLTESGNSVILHVGLSDEDQTSDSANSQDAYTFRIDVWSAGQVTKLTDSEAQTLEGTALHTFTDLTTTDYYISMIRNSATQCQLIIYSDSARTTVVEDSGIKTTTSGINGLRYFKVTNGGGSSGTGAIIGNIKNLKIYNGVTSIN